MRRSHWLKRKKTAAEIPFEPPIRLGNMSNGEFSKAFHSSETRRATRREFWNLARWTRGRPG